MKVFYGFAKNACFKTLSTDNFQKFQSARSCSLINFYKAKRAAAAAERQRFTPTWVL